MQHPVSADVADRIRRYRLARGMSTQALADAITEAGYPIRRANLARHELGTRHTLPVDIVAAAAEVFGLPIAAMFEGGPCSTCGDCPPEGFTCNGCSATGTTPRPEHTEEQPA